MSKRLEVFELAFGEGQLLFQQSRCLRVTFLVLCLNNVLRALGEDRAWQVQKDVRDFNDT